MGKAEDRSSPSAHGSSQRQRIIATASLLGCLFGAALLIELWEPKSASEVSAQRAPAPAEPIIFSTMEALLREKADYNRTAALVRLIRQAKWPPDKREYETTAQYRERLESRGPRIGRYPPGTQFVLLLPGTANYKC